MDGIDGHRPFHFHSVSPSHNFNEGWFLVSLDGDLTHQFCYLIFERFGRNVERYGC